MSTTTVQLYDKQMFDTTVKKLTEVGFNADIAHTKATNEVNHFISIIKNAPANTNLAKLAAENVAQCYEIIRTICRSGLTLNPVAKQVYLQPAYGGGIMFSISYLGLAYLAVKGGQIKHISAELVYKCDEFTFDKGTQTITHKPTFDEPRLLQNGGKQQSNPKNPIICGYTCIVFADGSKQYTDYDKSELDRLRTFAKQQYVWDSSPIQMSKKGMIRRTIMDNAYLLDYDRNSELFAAMQVEDENNYEVEPKTTNVQP